MRCGSQATLPIPWAIPYAVYDVAANAGWVNVGTDHDTAAFAVESIRCWWKGMGRAAYPHTRRLLITADADGVQQLRHPRVEGRTRRLGAGNQARRHGVPRPAWHLQVEQDRRAPLREAPVERDEETGEYRLLAGRCTPAPPTCTGGSG
jgi:hypothetical protein